MQMQQRASVVRSGGCRRLVAAAANQAGAKAAGATIAWEKARMNRAHSRRCTMLWCNVASEVVSSVSNRSMRHLHSPRFVTASTNYAETLPASHGQYPRCQMMRRCAALRDGGETGNESKNASPSLQQCRVLDLSVHVADASCNSAIEYTHPQNVRELID